MTVLDDWTNVGQTCEADVITIDFSKMFYVVTHQRLLSKLLVYGKNLLKTYLLSLSFP